MEQVFVTGATGFVGRHLLRNLLADNIPVVIMTRNPDAAILKELSITNQKQLTIYTADIQKVFDLPENITTVYHCAGVISDQEKMEGVNVKGTLNVVEASLRNGSRLIHLSSAGVTGETRENIITETIICHPDNKYEQTKLEAEKIIYAGITRGLKAQILRPTIIIGTGRSPNSDSFLQLLRSIKTGLYCNVNDGLYNIVHVDEVIRVMRMLDNDELPNGDTFIINTPIRYRDLAQIVSLATTGSLKEATTLPFGLAWLAGALLSSVSVISRRPMPFTLSRLRALTNRKVFIQNKLEDALHYQPLYPIEKYIEIICKEYQKLGLL